MDAFWFVFKLGNEFNEKIFLQYVATLEFVLSWFLSIEALMRSIRIKSINQYRVQAGKQ